MSNRARKDRKLNGQKFEKQPKTPTGTYQTKKETQKKNKRTTNAEQNAFAMAARMATWPPPWM